MTADDTTTSSQERSESGTSLSAKQVRDRYQQGLKSIRKETYEYWLNHAFLEGEQWLYWNTENRRLDSVPRDPERVQATIDRMGPSSRTVLSKLLSRPLVFDVSPTGADDATLQGAYTAQSIIESVRTEHDWERLREQAMWAVWKGGTAALVSEWDPAKGRPVGVSKATGREFGEGDTIESVLNIVEFVVEPGVRDAETARWWIRALALPPKTVQETYDLDEAPESDATAGMSPVQAKLLSSSTGGGSEQADLTLVLTYFERPNKEVPQGRVLTVVGEKVVEEKPWPFPYKDRLNIVILRESVIDGRWVGHTVVSKARPVQVAFNASWSSIIEHMKLAGNARLMVPNSSIDMIDEMSDLPGEMVPYPDGTEKPGYLSPPQMPGWWIEQPERLATQMDDILGVHDVSRGVTPANIESGVGLSILSENDNTPTGRLIQDTARAFGWLATNTLELYAAKVKETRKAVVRVPGYPPETTSWTGEDLMDQTRVTVPVEAIIPRSRAAMQVFAQKALELGLIKSFTEYAEVADLPDTHSLIEKVSPDVAKARRENHEMALGKVVVPDDFDNNTVHIEQHNNFRKSPRYALLTEEQKKNCALHIQGHEVLDAEQLARQLKKAMVSPVLASGGDANGAPTLPLGEMPGGAAPAGEPAPPPGGGGETPPVTQPDAPPAL